MAKLEIKVGASVDRNLQIAYRPIIEAAKRATAAITAEGKKAGTAISTETRKGTRSAEKEFDHLFREVSGKFPSAMNAGTEAVKKFGREAKASFAETRRKFQELARDTEREMNRLASNRANRQGMGSFLFNAAGGTAGVSAGFSSAGRLGLGVARRAAGAAFSLAGALARGAGVETDVGTIFRKNNNLESLAQDLSNQGVIASDPRNNTRVDKRVLMSQALDVAEQTGSDANKMLEGLEKFTAKTGDLRTGRDILKQMSIYGKASGSSIEDMMDAAGDLAGQLDGVENKGEAIQNLMRAFAGQGKLGAVEIKNLASQMSKIAASSGRFEGGTQSIIQFGVLAQMARQRGGAPTATSAAQSTVSFANTFSKERRLKAFAEFGIDTEGKGGKVKSPKQLLLEALPAAEKAGKGIGKGFDLVMGKMVADAKARQVFLGFEAIYKESGGGQKGIEKVTEAFERLEKAAIADEEIMSSFSRAMKTSESQADIFNTQIRKAALQMQTDLAPAMAALAKELVPLVKSLASWVGHVTGDKQAGAISELATGDVDDAVRRTQKQIEGGKISDAQIAENKLAASEAFENRARAAAEVKAAEEKLKTKKKDGGYDFWTNPGIENKWGKGFMGNLLGTDEETDKADIAEKKAALLKAQETYDKIAATNDEVKQKLNDKILVQIANVEELKAAINPPNVDGAGRGDSPEQKAKDR